MEDYYAKIGFFCHRYATNTTTNYFDEKTYEDCFKFLSSPIFSVWQDEHFFRFMVGITFTTMAIVSLYKCLCGTKPVSYEDVHHIVHKEIETLENNMLRNKAEDDVRNFRRAY